MTKFDLDNFLPYQLALLANRVSIDFAEIYKDQFGIDRAEWRVIAHLSQSDEPMSVRDLCKLAEMEKSKISRAISRLQNKGLVVKQDHTADKRLIAVTLTKEGKTMIQNIAPEAKAFDRNLRSKLGESEQVFQSAIRHLLQN